MIDSIYPDVICMFMVLHREMKSFVTSIYGNGSYRWPYIDLSYDKTYIDLFFDEYYTTIHIIPKCLRSWQLYYYITKTKLPHCKIFNTLKICYNFHWGMVWMPWQPCVVLLVLLDSLSCSRVAYLSSVRVAYLCCASCGFSVRFVRHAVAVLSKTLIPV